MSQVLLCGAMIVTLSMGIRHGFGLWLQPITMARGWSRETFAFALAVQNLAWGIAGPIAGALADRFGAYRVLVAGALLYAAGLATMPLAANGAAFTGAAGLLVGIAQSGVTYAVVYGVIGRNIAPQRRSWAMGVTAAAGSFGQFLMLPVESALISRLGWDQALYALALLVLVIAPLALGLREPVRAAAGGASTQGIGAALREAFGDRSFNLLTAGYFVCGFQVVFIGVHLPSYLKDRGFDPQVATMALALIGLFNVFGTYAAGALGQRWPKRYLLSTIYAARSLAIVLFLLLPLTSTSIYVFSAAMGLLWLSTVPLTNAVVAQIFGVQYLSMLSGFVFLSHQVGSFLGVWLGGKLFDATGSYDVVWWIAVALGVFAALINLPVREVPIARPLAAAA
ncbi:MAG: MFS transporter [Ideonella sp.]|nr:MAG: MFS transporter [Burkholderiaceae bacterium]MBE7425135.1 MFS transporter [Ideonella sp.]